MGEKDEERDLGRIKELWTLKRSKGSRGKPVQSLGRCVFSLRLLEGCKSLVVDGLGGDLLIQFIKFRYLQAQHLRFQHGE